MKALEIEYEEKLLLLIMQSLNKSSGVTTIKRTIKSVLSNNNISYKLIEVEYISTFILKDRALVIDYRGDAIILKNY